MENLADKNILGPSCRKKEIFRGIYIEGGFWPPSITGNSKQGRICAFTSLDYFSGVAGSTSVPSIRTASSFRVSIPSA